jgi:hypothetical protein
MALTPASALAQSSPWDRLDQDGALYAGTRDDRGDAVEVFCPVTGNLTLELKSQQFTISVPDGRHYSLIFVTDRGRTELVGQAKDSDVLYEAGDLNAHIQLQQLMDDIAASKSFTVRMEPFGWQGSFTAEGAADAMKGLLDRCR